MTIYLGLCGFFLYMPSWIVFETQDDVQNKTSMEKIPIKITCVLKYIYIGLRLWFQQTIYTIPICFMWFELFCIFVGT
jgi:hypothetical protein